MVLDLQKMPKEEYSKLDFDWYYYRKIVLNNNSWDKLIQWGHHNEVIDKPHYLLSVQGDGRLVRKYVTGYEIKTDWGMVELPVFDHERGRLKNYMKIQKQFLKLSIAKDTTLSVPSTAGLIKTFSSFGWLRG